MKCCDIKTNELKHRIDIIDYSSTIGDGGKVTKSYSIVTSLWAKIKPKTTSPLYEALGATDQTTHTITIRYYSPLNIGHLIRFGTRFFAIRSIINIEERAKYMEIECIENEKYNITI